jgi:hypothetical protein
VNRKTEGERVIRDARVASVGDVLFNDVPAQTWRWIES